MDGCWRCPYTLFAVCLAGLILCSYIHLQIILNNEREFIILKFVFSPHPRQLTNVPRLLQAVGDYKVIRRKRFLYLVQSENCLPENLVEYGTLGNGEDRDVIVLNWRERCREHTEKDLDHLEYIFNNKTSWGSGRNLLYQVAQERNRGYSYFIFMDEDITFSFTQGISTDVYKQPNCSALRNFERFLMDYQPAVGLTHFCSRCGKLLSNGSYVNSLCCSTRTASSDLPPLLPVSIGFDAAFNAFHVDAIEHILPYKLKYENESWWDSQKYVILKADVVFRGQVVRYNAITALNNKHRDYPRKILDNWVDILQEIRANTPSQYYNESVFRLEPLVDMVPEVSGNVMYTSRFNLTIPHPRTPLSPYSHFEKHRNNG